MDCTNKLFKVGTSDLAYTTKVTDHSNVCSFGVLVVNLFKGHYLVDFYFPLPLVHQGMEISQ
jgi:hypothetical protein